MHCKLTKVDGLSTNGTVSHHYHSWCWVPFLARLNAAARFKDNHGRIRHQCTCCKGCRVKPGCGTRRKMKKKKTRTAGENLSFQTTTYFIFFSVFRRWNGALPLLLPKMSGIFRFSIFYWQDAISLNDLTAECCRYGNVWQNEPLTQTWVESCLAVSRFLKISVKCWNHRKL